MSPRAVVLFNDEHAHASGEALDALAVEDVAAAARAVAAGLEARGWKCALLGLRDPRHALEALPQLRAEVVFNLVESLGGASGQEAGCAWLLELDGRPYTGSPPRALELCLDKWVAKAVLASRGLPVAAAVLAERGDEDLGGLRYPAIVKPVHEDASHGIALESVVPDAAAARARAHWVRATYRQAALVEEFVDGPEINVGLLAAPGGALQLLPLAEIDFSGFPRGRPRLVTYNGKWVEASEEYRQTLVVPARLDPAASRRVEEVARGAWGALGLRDYGRVDLRLDAAGEPRVIDVNPNPDLSPGAGFALAAARADLSHADLVARIASCALARAAPASSPSR